MLHFIKLHMNLHSMENISLYTRTITISYYRQKFILNWQLPLRLMEVETENEYDIGVSIKKFFLLITAIQKHTHLSLEMKQSC